MPELQGKFGVQVRARPTVGIAWDALADHRGTFAELNRFFEPNQSLMIEIVLQRHVGVGVFRLTQRLVPEEFDEQIKGKDIG